jgi:DNA modification methylase
MTSPPFFSDETETRLKASTRKQGGSAEVANQISQFALDLVPAFKEVHRVSTPGGHLVVHTKDIRFGGTLLPLANFHRQVIESCGFALQTKVFWRRTHDKKSPSAKFRRYAGKCSFSVDDLEEFLVFINPGAKEIRCTDIAPSKIQVFSEPVWEMRATRLPGTHPHPYPKLAVHRFIELFTRPGDSVLDPFAGSATTLIGAVELHRTAIGYEINNTYFRESVQNLQRITR